MANKEPNLRANDERKELNDSKAGKEEGRTEETDRGTWLNKKKENKKKARQRSFKKYTEKMKKKVRRNTERWKQR